MPRAAAGRGGGRKPKAAAGYQHSAALPEGFVLKDMFKKEWKVHRPVGQGGFGVIYLASKNDSTSKEAEYVIKMEPKENGPLFCECTFYQRAAKPELIQQWLSSKKKKMIGMPKFIALGFHEMNGVENRFMVMERFGTDLQKLFEQNGKRFQRKTVLQIAIRVLDTLEYIHSKEFVHADIKAANILLGYKNPNQVYLVDFGLAARYLQHNGSHYAYKEDPRKAHDGTIEFTSRDAHLGVASSRRSDLEILGYCMLQWLCGQLPWETNLQNKNFVRDQKVKYMDDIPGLMAKCFKGKDYPREIAEFLEYVNGLDYAEKPDYNKTRQIFQSAMKSQGYKDDKLDFAAISNQISNRGSPVKSPPRKKSSMVLPPLSPSPAIRNRISESSQMPTPAKSTKRASAAKSKVSRSRTPSSPENISMSEDSDFDMTPQKPSGSARRKRRSDASPAPTPVKQMKRDSEARGPSTPRGRKKANSTGEGAEPPKEYYEFMMKTKPTPRKVKKGPRSLATKATQTSPGLKGLKNWKKKP